MTDGPMDVLKALHDTAPSEADSLEIEAARLEKQAHEMRQRVAKLRACHATLERFG